MRLKQFLRRGRWDDERARELEAYLEIEADDNIARGMSPSDARAAARRKLGNTTLVREEIYEMNSIRPIETLRLDTRDAWRQLRRRPLVNVLAVLLLTIGIGASSAAFSVVYGVLMRPLDYPQGDRLATLWQQTEGRREQLSYPDLQDLRGAGPFEITAAIASGRVTLMAGANVDRVNVVDTDPELLPMLGARAALGRLLGEEDAGQRVAVLSQRLWRNVFHGDPDVVGRAINISGISGTVIGVLAAGIDFELPVVPGGGSSLGAGFTIKDVDIWTPLDAGGGPAHDRAVSTYEAIVRLRDGVSAEQAQRALDVVGANLARQYPDTNRNRSFQVVPLREQVVGAKAPVVLLAFAGSALILVIACVNLVSLCLGELPARRRDFALREALGAGRARLLRQVMVESLMISAAGAAAGLLIARLVVQSLKASADLPRLDAIRFDSPILLFSIGAAALVSLVARVAPMWRLEGAHDGLRAGTSAYATSAPRLRRTLVTAQIALALVLSATATLFGVSLRELARVDPGFSAGHVLSARASAYQARYPQKANVVRFFYDLIPRIAGLPGVTTAAAGSALPLTGSGSGAAVAVEGRVPPMAERPGAGWQTVTPGYFATVGMPILAGRDFTLADLDRPAHHVVINQALARLVFRDENPIGRRLLLGPDGSAPDWHEVVGVVGDVRHTNLAFAGLPHAYDLFGEHWSRTMFLVAKSRMEPYAVAPLVRREVRQLDAEVPVFEVRSLDDIVGGSIAARRLASGFALALAGVSLLLAAIGVYGLLASTVTARMREFGIRRALGSSSSQIVTLIAAESAALVAVGIPAGIALALASGRLIESQLFGVGAGDPRVLAGVAAMLVAIGAAAASVPARRAARVDPAITLREE